MHEMEMLALHRNPTLLVLALFAAAAAASAEVLIAAGDFSYAGGVAARNVAQWNGSVWAPIGSGLNQHVYNIAWFNGEVIATGNFSGHIARWDGAAWATLGGGFNDCGTSLHVHNGVLFAGGYFSVAGGVPARYFAQWDGGSWTRVSGVDLVGLVHAMATYEGDLIISGTFKVPFVRVARWDGTTWSQMGSGFGSHPTAFTVFQGILVAGGIFDYAGDGAGSTLRPSGTGRTGCPWGQV